VVGRIQHEEKEQATEESAPPEGYRRRHKVILFSTEILKSRQAADATLLSVSERCFAGPCSSGPLPAHRLFDQSDDDHQDTPSDPTGCDLTDDRADVEASSAGSSRFRSAAD
jgi:hypothetical protein